MGELSEMILDGILCQECGVFIENGEALGVPRSCEDCAEETQA